MNIAVNTRLLIKDKLEGIGWFSYENLRRITQAHPEHTFFFLFDRPFHKDFIFSDNVHPYIISPPARHPILFYIWFEIMIPYVLKKIKADLFVSPDGYNSLRTKVPSVVVMHDLNFEYYPKDLPFAVRKHYKYYFPRYARKADRIATVSEYSKQDISRLYRVHPDKIDVVYNGANELFGNIDEEEKERVKNQYTKGKPYFVFVGALHPRKNLVNLFKAFDSFRESNSQEIKLLIVGQKMFLTSGISDAYERMKFKKDVVFTNRLPMAELRKTLGAAIALTYVSYFEGFGIPIVEAFNAQVPVITSNVTSMPEVAGDAALLVDPHSVDSISTAMQQIVNDKKLRQSLVEKGNKRKQMFTWDKSAERLWTSIEKALIQS